jgi:diacylglycerol kinase
MIARTFKAAQYSLLGLVEPYSTSRKGKAALLAGLVVVCICSTAFVLLSKTFSFTWVPAVLTSSWTSG